MRRAGAITLTIIAALTLGAGAALAAVTVRTTVDREAPDTALPKQTFSVRGLASGAKYRLEYRIAGRTASGCATRGSSIYVVAHRGKARFEKLPNGSYDSRFYKGFCAGREYKAKVLRIVRGRAVVVKRFVITGAPRGGRTGGGTGTGTGEATDANATVTFTDDPNAPAGSVPAKIAHLSRLRPGSSYLLHLKNRGASTDCFAEGNAGHSIAPESGAYDATVPTPYYGQGYDLCAGATYDVTLSRVNSDGSTVPVLTTAFTASQPR